MNRKKISFSKINEPEYRHLKLLGFWLLYFALYFLTEALIPAERCIPVRIFLDDLIPFCEIFVIPYVAWYLLIVFSLWFFAVKNVQNFTRLQIYITVTQLVAMFIYIVFPTRQDLRPEVLPRENFLSDIVSLLYSLDTNTGVCPSLHCAYSIGIASVWCRERSASVLFKIFMALFCLTICLSTAFIKQHSVFDFLMAFPLCALAEIVSSYFVKRLTKV